MLNPNAKLPLIGLQSMHNSEDFYMTVYKKISTKSSLGVDGILRHVIAYFDRHHRKLSTPSEQPGFVANI